MMLITWTDCIKLHWCTKQVFLQKFVKLCMPELRLTGVQPRGLGSATLPRAAESHLAAAPPKTPPFPPHTWGHATNKQSPQNQATVRNSNPFGPPSCSRHHGTEGCSCDWLARVRASLARPCIAANIVTLTLPNLAIARPCIAANIVPHPKPNLAISRPHDVMRCAFFQRTPVMAAAMLLLGILLLLPSAQGSGATEVACPAGGVALGENTLPVRVPWLVPAPLYTQARGLVF